MKNVREESWKCEEELFTKIENELIRIVEEFDGKCPTLDEITKFGEIHKFPNGHEIFFWRNQPILVCDFSKCTLRALC